MEQQENIKMDVSIIEILRSDQILLHTNEFTLRNGESKRNFILTKQLVELGTETCYMVLMHEQTANEELK